VSRFISHVEGVYDVHETAEEARDACETVLAECRREAEADGSWPDDVESIWWAEIREAATEIDLVDVCDEDEEGGLAVYTDYEIRSVDAGPTREVLADRIATTEEQALRLLEWAEAQQARIVELEAQLRASEDRAVGLADDLEDALTRGRL
jgi:hypothetical protein